MKQNGCQVITQVLSDTSFNCKSNSSLINTKWEEGPMLNVNWC